MIAIGKESYPYFSIVVPLYNKDKYISRAVNSVLGQQFNDFELIVVDDGSTDSSRAVVESFADSRIRLICQSNQGEGAARNTGMLTSKGSWIAFLDADDMWTPNHLNTLRGMVKEFPDAGIISSRTFALKTTSELPKFDSEGLAREINYFTEAAKDIGVITSSSTAIKRGVFEDLGGFGNFKQGADLEYWARVSLKYPVVVSDLITAIYFRGTGGIMETVSSVSDSNSSVLPCSLAHVSPSVAMLFERFSEFRKDHALFISVARYINSRLRSAMRGSFIKGDISRMRALKDLRIKSEKEGFDIWLVLSKCPTVFVIFLSNRRKVLKKLYRGVKI